jgi:indole-3-acetate monooxygenase
MNEQVAPTFEQIMAAVTALEPEIKAASDTIEAERRLPVLLAHKLMEAGVFRMGTPRVYGGGELDPMSQVRVVEGIIEYPTPGGSVRGAHWRIDG